MADTKISALSGATTPLDGTEVLPIVQSGATVKVANNDLRPKQIQSNATSGVLQVAGPSAATTRVMTTPDASFTAARIDAAQTFTGDQTFSNNIGIAAAPSGWSSVFSVLELSGNGAVMGISGLNLFNNAYYNGSDYIYKTTAPATRLLNSSGEWYWYRAASGTAGTAIVFGTPKMTLDASDNLTLNTGNLVIGTSGKGIDFSANTGVAGMTSELLDWYEEGTWTPTPQNYEGTPTVEGYYTRIGDTVFASFYIALDGTADGSTFSVLAPFGSITTTNAMFGATISYTTSTVNPTVRIRSFNTEFRVYNDSGTELTYNTFGASAVIAGTLIYKTI